MVGLGFFIRMVIAGIIQVVQSIVKLLLKNIIFLNPHGCVCGGLYDVTPFLKAA